MKRKLYDFAAFQVGWFACVLGAAREHEHVGPFVVLAILAAHFAITRDRRGAAVLSLCSLAVGLAVNTILQASGSVVAPGPITGPAWLLALWPLFAMLFDESMSWLRGRYALAAILGAVGAPLSYWGGERAGALRLGTRPLDFVLIAATWSVAMLVLLACQAKYAPLTARARSRSRSSG